MTAIEFNETLKTAIEEKGVKQNYLAKNLQISPQNFHAKMMSGKWSIDQVSKLMKLLDIPSDILMR